MKDARQGSPSQITPMEAISLSKFRDTALIASAILTAFVVAWIGGSNFAPSGLDGCFTPRGLKSNASPRPFDAGKESIVSTSEAGRPNTWEAATVTGLRLRPLTESSGPSTSSPVIYDQGVLSSSSTGLTNISNVLGRINDHK